MMINWSTFERQVRGRRYGSIPGRDDAAGNRTADDVDDVDIVRHVFDHLSNYQLRFRYS